MRKVRIVSAMLAIVLGVTGCGRISKLTDKKSEQEKVRVIQNEKLEKNEQTEAPEPEEKEKKLLVANRSRTSGVGCRYECKGAQRSGVC